MLNALTKTFKKILGNKAERDLKEVNPLVDKIKAVYPILASLTNDQLRDKTTNFKAKITAYVADELAEISKFKEEAELEKDINAKEDLYAKADKVEEGINEKLEEVLLEILPEAFAVVKETARRFTENSTIEVTATQMD